MAGKEGNLIAINRSSGPESSFVESVNMIDFRKTVEVRITIARLEMRSNALSIWIEDQRLGKASEEARSSESSKILRTVGSLD